MSSLSFNISGLSAAIAKVEGVADKAQAIVKGELAAFALDTATDAKVNVPVDLGYLRNSIQYSLNGLEAFINVNAFYAAYVEFGTGSHVFEGDFIFTPEMRSYAATFLVSGKGHLPATPYLFPAYEKNRLLLIERLKAYATAK